MGVTDKIIVCLGEFVSFFLFVFDTSDDRKLLSRRGSLLVTEMMMFIIPDPSCTVHCENLQDVVLSAATFPGWGQPVYTQRPNLSAK